MRVEVIMMCCKDINMALAPYCGGTGHKYCYNINITSLVVGSE